MGYRYSLMTDRREIDAVVGFARPREMTHLNSLGGHRRPRLHQVSVLVFY